MRRCALLVCLAASVSPAFAAKRVTVEQLQQVLSAIHAKPDAEIALQLSALQLTERLDTAKLQQLEGSLPGPQARQALTALADLSAFLSVPQQEIPATPAPDLAEQRRILALTVTYVSKTLHQLPNFSATRITTSFQDLPEGYEKGGTVFSPAQPLAKAGTASATVFYRDGGEVVNASAKKGKKGDSAQGLSTSGEFGPILATTLLDAAHSKLAWGHWEQDQSGPVAIPVAVFDYSVPKDKSHYEVSFCCFVAGEADPNDLHPFHEIAGYHGEITVDPATGTVLRVTAQADLKPSDPLVRADIMVEYGAVELGGSSYTCPLKSVSVSQADVADMAVQRIQFSPGHLQTLLNDAAFEQYHLFHADARLLAASEGLPSEQPAIPPSANTSTADASTPNPPTPRELPKAPQNSPPVTSTVTNTASSPTQPSTPTTEASATAPPPEPAAAQPTAEPAFDVPSLSTRNQAQVPVFKATSEAVVVDIVVTKGHDEPVTGLRKEDFQIREDGKPQPVDFFEEHAPDNAPAVPLPQMPPNVFTNQPVVPPGDSVNVLLLDSLNTDRGDQAFVQQQILKYLKTMDPSTRIAVFALSSKLRMVQGFSSDSSVLQASLKDPNSGAATTTTAMSRSLQDKLDDQDEIANLSAVQMSPIGIQAVQASQANHAIYQADQRVKMTLEAMNLIARYLAGIPGRKNLIWFSGSFPISVFPDAKTMLSSDTLRQYGPAIRQTADLLTLSKIAVYPVGAEGVVTEHPMEASNAVPTNTEGPSADNRMAASTSQRQSDVTAPYSAEQSARAAKISAMEQLAADTGGQAILNTNDLDKAIARAVQNGSHYYTLVYTPTDKEMDGKYRRIEVKLHGAKYKLSYRRGYYADAAARDSASSRSSNLDSSDDATTADPLRHLLARGMPSSTQLLYGVRVLPATSQPASTAPHAGGNTSLTGPLIRYSIDFLIRWTDVDLQLTPQGNHAGKLQLGVIAYGRDGKPVNWVGVSQIMNLNPATFAAIQKSGIPAHLEIDLPSQDVYLATGVYDWASGTAGTLEVPLNFLQAQTKPAVPQTSQAKPN
jgi:VWFA-related protein